MTNCKILAWCHTSRSLKRYLPSISPHLWWRWQRSSSVIPSDTRERLVLRRRIRQLIPSLMGARVMSACNRQRVARLCAQIFSRAWLCDVGGGGRWTRDVCGRPESVRCSRNSRDTLSPRSAYHESVPHFIIHAIGIDALPATTRCDALM